ncbi:hypothetical protein BH11MYX4_BH11MYX4_16880 [soil metagenome]
MSGIKKETTKHAHPTSSWKLTGPWASAWKVFATIGGLGILAAAAGFTMDPRRFAFSWMFAYVTCLSIALGAIFFVLIQRLTSAGWSVTVRRTAEFFGYGILALIPLFIPVLMSMGHLFPWLNAGHAAETETPAAVHGSISLITPAHAQEHAAPPADHAAAPGEHGAKPAPTGHGAAAAATPDGHEGDPAAHGASAAEHAQHEAHALIHSDVMAKKSAYLNKNFFYLRACLYFLIWTVLAVRLFGYSAAQDASKDPQLTVRAQAFAPPATFLFALSLTFAAFDWIMSLEPTWFSTIFGVYFFATGVVSSYAVLILVTMALRNSGPLQGAVTVEHFHDLGKLMFGFLVFWAYIGFSQFMLIWYAALPEETTWYHNRWDHDPWAKVSMLLLIGHFVIPFFWTISRTFKRNLGRLQIGAAILLVMHVVDMYWFVMPNYLLGKDGFSFSWIDLACLCAVAGVYGAFVFYRMTKYSLVPVGDPRLERSLHFQNA